MEDYRWIYLIILLQAVLLGTVLFFGQDTAPSSAQSGLYHESSIREIAGDLLQEHFERCEDRSLPPDSRITGFIIEDIKIREESCDYAVLLALVSFKPYDIDISRWAVQTSRDGQWIKDLQLTIYLERDQSGRFSIIRTDPSI
ncbi:MAG: hypothetical protein JW701_04300 [Kosmotogaceae bacterium]|nr:hypothetical protein [Kosmotogaceae bacterium]